MSRCATSMTLQKIISKYFEKLNRYLDQAISQANEMTMASESIAGAFGHGHDITELQVRRLRLDGFKSEVSRLEQEYSHLRDTKTLFFREQMTITNRFYESVCGASRKIFNRALRDAKSWNDTLMTPLEHHMRDRQAQLSRRLDSVKRIYLKEFNNIYNIVIDSTSYNASFILAESTTKEFGFETYIDIKNLSKGKHLLKLQRDQYNEKDTTVVTFSTIPFWYFRN